MNPAESQETARNPIDVVEHISNRQAYGAGKTQPKRSGRRDKRPLERDAAVFLMGRINALSACFLPDNIEDQQKTTTRFLNCWH